MGKANNWIYLIFSRMTASCLSFSSVTLRRSAITACTLAALAALSSSVGGTGMFSDSAALRDIWYMNTDRNVHESKKQFKVHTYL